MKHINSRKILPYLFILLFSLDISGQNNLVDINSFEYTKGAFKKGHSGAEVIHIPKGQRPLPSNYLKWRYRHRHLRSFKRGASFLIPEITLEKFGREKLGRPDGLFVMSKNEMDDLISKSSGNLNYVENQLGIPQNSWKNSTIIRIDIQKPKKHHLRIPSGNETGANELWIPGGKLPNGYRESVIDQVTQGKYKEIKLNLK